MKFILLFFLILFPSFLFAQPLQETPDFKLQVKIENDTVRALNNLFQRKRGANRAGTVIFGALTVSSIVAGASSGLTGNFLIAGVFGILTISSAKKANRYSAERLEEIIKDYENNKPLPSDVLKKLKTKDFQ